MIFPVPDILKLKFCSQSNSVTLSSRLGEGIVRPWGDQAGLQTRQEGIKVAKCSQLQLNIGMVSSTVESIEISQSAVPQEKHDGTREEAKPSANMYGTEVLPIQIQHAHKPMNQSVNSLAARGDLDDSLTNLSWLHAGSALPTPPSSHKASTTALEPSECKPSQSYTTLICMALRESHKKRLRLSGIYNWMTSNFAYFQARATHPSWKNSIRHCLSWKKCFQKVTPRRDEPGKGSFWQINPDLEEVCVRGIINGRRCIALPSAHGAPCG